MNRRRFFPFLLLLCCLPFVSGCTAMLNPLQRAEATPVPGLAMRLHAASASETNVDMLEATLYYRFLTQPMLASETRTLTVPRDESMEMAIVKALLEGPSAGHSDLKRLLPDSVVVESVTPRGNLLFVTLSEALLTDDGIPANWAELPEWAVEAPLRRRLAIQSLVASLTESFPYSGVQILVRRISQAQTSLRLDNAYFLSAAQGLSEPLTRDESLLLTPQNTARLFLEAWQTGDGETLYAYLANADAGSSKPSYQEAAVELDKLPALTDFTLEGGGSVSADGQRAVVTLDLTLVRNGESAQWTGYPLTLTRENDIWRIRYSQLQRFMEQ